MNCKICSKQFPNQYLLQRHLNTIAHKKRTETRDMYYCSCGKSYNYRQGLSRHKEICQKNQEIALIEARHESEKIELKKQIETLLDKVGTTNIENQTNIKTNIENQTNININYYGCENLEYITDKFIQEMMKIPYGSIPNIIKHIHFHPAHPENHNVKITNRKLPYASIYKNDKWELVHKKNTIEELMKKSYDMMDDRFLHLLSDKGRERYQTFQEKMDTDPEALKLIYQETELCLLNK